MKLPVDRIFRPALLLAFAAWAIGAWFDVAGQRTLFVEKGAEELYDFWMPRMCWEQGYAAAKPADYGLSPEQGSVRLPNRPIGDFIEISDWHLRTNAAGARERVFITGTVDKVYPALAILPFSFFPATRAGGYAWSVGAALVFLLACWLCTDLSPRILIVLACSMPVLFNLERGNPVWLSAAAVAVFLVWWNSPKPWQRALAALALAFAAVLKIAPAALGLLYVFDSPRLFPLSRSLRCALLAAFAALLLFFIPFLFVREGLAAIPLMIANAAHHADVVLRASDFGFVQPWRALRILFGQSVATPWPGMYLVARLSQLFGLIALVIGARRRDYFLLVSGMLLAAGNMYYYAALYLIPVFLLPPDRSPRLRSSTLAWLVFFVILCPLQLVFAGHSANAILCNLSVMFLMVRHLFTTDS